MKVPLFHWLTPSGLPPLWQTTDALHEPVPALTPSTHQVGNSVFGVKHKPSCTNLCHSRATPDSQAHRTMFYGKFGTHFAKYFKPEEFNNCRSAGLWWQICSSIQINLTKYHQRKVILEISLFLHLCGAVLGVPVGCHWLWCIASLCSDMLHYSSLKWVRFQFPRTIGKLDLSWLVDLPKWGRPQLQQHKRVLVVAQTVLRHSLGISLGECTSSWQESFIVDKFWSKSFVYSFTKTKGGITPREGIKRC